MEKQYEKEKLEEIKNNIQIEQIFDLLGELGGEPRWGKNDSYFISQTLCHNPAGQGSHKLYYYDNTKLFKCFTDCGDTFDIFELVMRHMNTIGEKKQYYSKGELKKRKWEVFDAIEFVLLYFHISTEKENFLQIQRESQEWEYLNNLNKKIDKNDNKKRVELQIFDTKILQHLPHPRIIPWEEEGITRDVMESRGICFDPKNYGIVIPHYDINNNLVGIRERTLVKENEEFGKYRPAILGGKMYNHPLSFNLYNINNAKNNIRRMEKVFVFEGEKSPLLYASYFGIENDISVATCGFNLLNYQVELLMNCGAKEIIICFDKQFKEIGDAEWEKLVKNLTNIHNKYGAMVQISYLFDKEDLLEYKESPIDAGPEIFMKLFKERIFI